MKETPGSVNIPVKIGDVTIAPGDIVCADDDGVVVVSHGSAEAVMKSALARIEREATKRQRLAAGELTLEMDGLRDKLIEMGVEFVDSVEIE